VNLWAVGFDLGDTLCEYAGVPLDWARDYPAALTAVARSCGIEPTPERLRAGAEVLLRYNTRRTPRPGEQEFPAERVFGELLAEWTASLESLPAAVDAFFGHFRRSLRPFPESAPVLAALRRLGVPAGILTDVPYGMPRHLVAADVAEAQLAIPDDLVLASTTVGHRKPNPAGFRALASRLGASCDRMTLGTSGRTWQAATRPGARPSYCGARPTKRRPGAKPSPFAPSKSYSGCRGSRR
jgi:putative hydrolase of the HAD superfamily